MSQGFKYFMVFLSQSTGQKAKAGSAVRLLATSLVFEAVACFYIYTHNLLQNKMHPEELQQQQRVRSCVRICPWDFRAIAERLIWQQMFNSHWLHLSLNEFIPNYRQSDSSNLTQAFPLYSDLSCSGQDHERHKDIQSISPFPRNEIQKGNMLVRSGCNVHVRGEAWDKPALASRGFQEVFGS